MSKNPPRFPAIDHDALDAVSGGRRAASTSRAGDDRIMDTLNSLENSIRDLGRNQQPQTDAASAMMPLLAMSMMNQQPAAPVAPVPPQVICVRGRRRC